MYDLAVTRARAAQKAPVPPVQKPGVASRERLRPDAGAAARRVLREKKSPVQFWNPLPYTTH